MRPSRRDILDEHELLPAPRACQELFWLQYNRQKKRWRTAHLGDVVAGVVSDASMRAAQRLGGVAEAWGQVVPAEYAASARVESFRGGRLVVTVDSAATKYVLGRQGLLSVLNERIVANEGRQGGAVRQLEFRVGPPVMRTSASQDKPKRGGKKER